MAISPPSDIVLDVARAADPTQYKAAVDRLARMGGAANVEEFAGLMAGGGSSGPQMPFDPASALTRLQESNAQARASLNPYQRFEAFLLQTFVEAMLPENTDNVIGKGTAGRIWKSMLAEQIGMQMSRSGGIGLADKLSAAQAAADKARTDTSGDA